jgi:hypothetical protein
MMRRAGEREYEDKPENKRALPLLCSSGKKSVVTEESVRRETMDSILDGQVS